MIAVFALALTFLFPIASFSAKAPLGVPVSGELNIIPKDNPNMMNEILNGQPVTMGQKGFIKVWPLTVLTLLTTAIAMVTIFLYKNRVLQMRVLAVGFLLGVINIFLVFLWAVDTYVDNATTPMACTEINLKYDIGTWGAIAAIVLMFLAQRSIKKDEAKVRASDRLR